MTWRCTQIYTAASQSWPSYSAVAGLWRRCHCNWREGQGHDPEPTRSRMLLVSGLLSLPLNLSLQREKFSLCLFLSAVFSTCFGGSHVLSTVWLLHLTLFYPGELRLNVMEISLVSISSKVSFYWIILTSQCFLRKQQFSFVHVWILTFVTPSPLPSPHSISMSVSRYSVPGMVCTRRSGQRGRVLCVCLCVCVHVCMCLCVNKIKWEWMCGPPRGLAARAVYNLQATSLLLFCPLPSSFLPLPVFFYCFFLWLQMREEKHVDIIQYQAVKLKSRGQQYGHRILCRDEPDGWMDREDQQLECVHTKHVWTDSHCKSVAFFRALKYY